MARLFARHGYELVLVARGEAKLRELGLPATIIAADLTDPAAPQRIVEELRAKSIDVDVLVNNAGVGVAGPFVETDLQSELAMIQLNVVINGRPTTNASVKLMRQGAEVGTLKSGADFVPISPGKYEAEVKAEGASIAVHGLMFPEGATQTVPVNVQM